MSPLSSASTNRAHIPRYKANLYFFNFLCKLQDMNELSWKKNFKYISFNSNGKAIERTKHIKNIKNIIFIMGNFIIAKSSMTYT